MARFSQHAGGQAAIAIEDAQLFENLERSHRELSQAYDATIEGWSRALDLRDKETEGHTLRVTEMTLKLARAFGLSEKDLLHIRRGALLYDIGKMGWNRLPARAKGPGDPSGRPLVRGCRCMGCTAFGPAVSQSLDKGKSA